MWTDEAGPSPRGADGVGAGRGQRAEGTGGRGRASKGFRGPAGSRAVRGQRGEQVSKAEGGPAPPGVPSGSLDVPEPTLPGTTSV